jgi:hypothetical protein
MIVSKIMMGQGNQMFQYAAGRALSLHHNESFKVDTSNYEGYKHRRYELSDYFCIDVPEATAEDLKKYKFIHPVKRIWNKLVPAKFKLRQLGLGYESSWLPRTILGIYDKINPPHRRIQYEEPHYHFDTNFFNANSNIYLKGYWMSYKYFERYSAVIRKDFTVKPQLVEHLADVVRTMKQENSVSILFRRGDLVTNKHYTKIKGIIPLSFYHGALAMLEKKFGKLTIYLFSDEIEWVTKNLNTTHHIVPISNHISKSGLEDYYLMSSCKYNIIANSTFGWWAGWMNDYAEKIVIAPSGWYSKYVHYNQKDVYPDDWVVIDHPYWDGK